ncbi:MAG TPA: hypothetical protein VF992_10640 [Thermoplasmata archaeon]
MIVVSAAEVQLVYVFSGMLVLGAVFLVFLPALHHAWTYAASRRSLGLLIAVVALVAIGALALVVAATSDPVNFIPIAGITVGLRLGSPYLLYRGIRDRFETSRVWGVVRWVVALGFLGFAAFLAYHVALIASGVEPPVVASLSEKLLMAFGASVLIVRAGLRIRPREATAGWPYWSAAVLFAIAFVVVLPYAIPAFEIAYAVSGAVGWSAASVAAARDI